MEISEISIISDFQAGMKCLQTPSMVSRLLSMESYPNLQFYSFWKWGAILFAIYATFSSLVKKIKLVFIYFHRVKPSLLHQKFEQILAISDYDEDIDISLASSSSSDDDDDRELEVDESEDDDSFSSHVKGSRLWLRSQWQNGQLWQNSLTCNISKDNVVRFWDRLGLDSGFDKDLINSDVVVSTWGFDSDHHEDGYGSKDERFPSVVFTAEGDGKGDGVVVRGFDSRLRRRTPALYGEWSSQPADGCLLYSIFSGERVYVNAGGSVAVGDVRNMKLPLDGNGNGRR